MLPATPQMMMTSVAMTIVARMTDPLAWLSEVDPRFLAALTRGNNGPVPPPELTLGPQWCKWIETNCVMGEGDRAGEPVAVEPWQRALIWKVAEIRPNL